MITAAGTCLGIAFLVSVWTNIAIMHGAGVEMEPDEEMRNNWLVIMSLLVAAVGISNSMFMAVTERYREIGTMKCLGAVDRFVVELFLLESGMLGGVGAIIGGVGGFLILMLVSLFKRQAGDFFGMDWGYMGTHFLYAVGIGIIISVLAAALPAARAAKLPPAAALRTDV
jgi:ABC-type antimicrobial peptide transport system permease subunit